ncbi:DUF4956 domain-containing protein [Echinicola rosea]|uniref:DUF4956 domain-containing protein n=1 Tax=Echinicola rosea TaxID=1807691 RepID=A0ABQ1V359_9BACT|nr:DUF4956 domain-containing protein [Echinicola rosea]GGF33906.1 DUF4956 domain-containing protein [Echinicola rosea]
MDYFSLQTTAEYPAFFTVLYSVMFAFSLAVLVAFTYYKTSEIAGYSATFIQALVLSPIVAIMVIQAIGDSVAIGLGMLGALAIIRFRTNFRNPRNIIFLFASLAIGISCGVYGYAIAIVGTLFFCLTAFILNLTSFGKNHLPTGMLRINYEGTEDLKDSIEKELSNWCKSFNLQVLRSNISVEDFRKYQFSYQVRMKNQQIETQLLASLQKINPNFSLRMEYDIVNETFN